MISTREQLIEWAAAVIEARSSVAIVRAGDRDVARVRLPFGVPPAAVADVVAAAAREVQGDALSVEVNAGRRDFVIQGRRSISREALR